MVTNKNELPKLDLWLDFRVPSYLSVILDIYEQIVIYCAFQPANLPRSYPLHFASARFQASRS